MAGGDRRGPEGRGPMTGRGLGYCGGYDGPGYEAGDAPVGSGRGFGRRGRGRQGGFGRGLGRGYRSRTDYAETEAAPDLGALAGELAQLRAELAALAARLDESTNRD